MRLGLAAAFFSLADVLLLDEPTNHLDIRGVLWLRHRLSADAGRSERTAVAVSHDEAFLDAVCTDVILFADKRLEYHTCSYSQYVEAVSQRTTRHATKARSQLGAFPGLCTNWPISQM